MPQLSIAITRPEQDGRQLADRLGRQGHAVYQVPMLRIDYMRHNVPELVTWLSQPLQAICVTSKHALPLLQNIKMAKTIPLFVVGSATALAAETMGFRNVTAAGGDAESLLALMTESCERSKGPLLYLRGKDITCDLKKQLLAQEFAAEEMLAYEAVALDIFPPDYLNALEQGNVDEVWFYSVRSARNYVRLAGEYKAMHRRITALCMSDQIAKAAEGLPWKEIRIKAAPEK